MPVASKECCENVGYLYVISTTLAILTLSIAVIKPYPLSHLLPFYRTSFISNGVTIEVCTPTMSPPIISDTQCAN